MTKYQAILGAAVLSATVLAGCSSSDALNAKLDAIAADVDALKAQQSKLAKRCCFC